jgi:hypothetical protein
MLNTSYTMNTEPDMESLSTRVKGWLRKEIVDFGRRQREGPSEALRRVTEEWWAMSRFPAIEFRDGVTGRRAGVRGGPDVWEVVMVWKDHDPNREGLYDHFGGHVSQEGLDQALAYHERFSEEIDERIEENRRVAGRLESAVSPR